jgi:hypothetical protein
METPHPKTSEFSRREFGSVSASPPLDSMTIFAFLESALCAVILVALIWTNRSNSVGHWRLNEAAMWALVCYAPIANLAWSAIPRMARPGYVWLRRSIQIHAIAAITVAGISSSASGSPLPPSYGVLALCALLIDLFILGFSPWASWDADDIEKYRAALLKVAGGAVAAVFVWSFVNAGVVIAQSEFIAWGKPYCLQVQGDLLGGYKPVNSLMDLNGLRMHSPFTSGGGSGEYQLAYHAVLVVDRDDTIEWRHWSYTTQRFVRHDNWRGIAIAGRPDCEPRRHLASQLSIW